MIGGKLNAAHQFQDAIAKGGALPIAIVGGDVSSFFRRSLLIA
ncbi:MAG: hypothetical protein V7K47_24130 [Nostoc sp.]